jgi:hypothetical protein
VNDLKLINKGLKGLHMPLSYNMVFPRKPRKILKEIMRIRVKVTWQPQGFKQPISNFYLKSSGMIMGSNKRLGRLSRNNRGTRFGKTVNYSQPPQDYKGAQL